MVAPNFNNYPEELKGRRQWTLWKQITRAGKATKVPFQPNGYEGDSSDPSKWCSFSEAVEAYQKGEHDFDGVGFTFDPLDPYAGVDLDHCISEDGTIKPKAKEILDKLNSYSEVSPSGKGIKIFPKAKIPVSIRRDGGKFQQGFKIKLPDLEFEVYYGDRFFTLTGNRLQDYPATIEDRNEELTEIFKELFKDRHYFDGEPGPQREREEKIEPLSSDAAERLQALFDADPTFKNELFTPVPSGDRSTFECYLCARLWEAAFDRPEIMCIMDSSPQTKWLERDRSYRWSTIEAGIAKSEESHQPGMKPVTKENVDGTVGICPITGAVKKVVVIRNEETGKIDRFLVWVSDCALYIHTETNAKDDSEFVFAGVGAIDKRTVKFTLPASALAEPRKFKAACINAFGARNRFGDLNFEIVQKITTHPKRMQRVEVPDWRENIPLLPGVDLVDKTEFRLSSKIPAAVYVGDLDKAKAILQKLLKVHKYALLLVATILGSPAIARWHKNDRFGLGLWGLTGTLKTSAALAAMGIYGTGYLDGPKLKAGKGGSTIVGAMEVFAAAGFLPQILDDVKTVDSKDAQNYVAVIHSVLEGEEKARGKKDGGLRDGREFSSTPIITGEVRPQEASTTARVFNLNWTRADAKLLSEVQSNAALLPVIGYHWLRFLADTDFILGKDFEAFRSKKMEEFLGLKYTNPGRLATIYSLFVSVWDLLEASPLGDVFTEARESFKAALLEATATQGAAVTEETEISRFLSALEELLASNPGIIMSKEGKKVIIGSIIGKRTDLGLFLLPTQTMNELIKIRAFNQQPTIDSITQALNEKGILIHGEDRLMTRLRIGGDRVYGWLIKWASLEKDGASPPNEDGENDRSGTIVPVVPPSPAEICENNSEKKMEQFGDHQKKLNENTGDSEDSEDREIEKREIDSDYGSKVSVISGVLGDKGDEDNCAKCGIGPHPRKDEPTPTKKVSATTKEKVRILAVDGYRTQIPLPDNPNKFVDHLFNFGEVVEFQHWKAKKLVERGIAEAVPA